MRLRLLRLRFLALCCVSLLAACDQLGIESPQKETERKEAEAKAIGSACRQAGRAIEDCYNLNPKASKSAIFGGWREMDEYMRENKLDIVAPTVPTAASKTKRAADEESDSEEDAAPAESSADKAHGDAASGKKAADKPAAPRRTRP